MSSLAIEHWSKGQRGQGVREVRLDQKATTPPSPYTEHTLLADMTGVAKFVADPRLRDVLRRGSKGLGTPATQADIIERLKDSGGIEVKTVGKEKQLRSTARGRAVIAFLPKMLTDPGTTAIWEQMLEMISKGEITLEEFYERQVTATRGLVEDAKTRAGSLNIGGGGQGAEVVAQAPCSVVGCSGGGILTKKKGKFGLYWSCSNAAAHGGQCAHKFDEVDGKPVVRESITVEPLPGDGGACPKCKKGHLTTKVVTNHSSKAFGKSYLACSNFPACKHSEWPK